MHVNIYSLYPFLCPPFYLSWQQTSCIQYTFSFPLNVAVTLSARTSSFLPLSTPSLSMQPSPCLYILPFFFPFHTPVPLFSDKTVPLSTCSFILLWVLNTIWISSLTFSYTSSLWCLEGCNSCLAISLSIYEYICFFLLLTTIISFSLLPQYSSLL